MKVLAARPQDTADISRLIDHLGLTSVDQVPALCAEIFPDEPVPARVRLTLQDLFEAQHPGSESTRPS